MDESNATATVSLKELIAHESLSDITLLFNGECNLGLGMSQPPRRHRPTCNGSSVHDGKRSFHALNAAKLSLLLTKAVVKISQGTNGGGGDDIHLPSLRLDNFTVTLTAGEAGTGEKQINYPSEENHSRSGSAGDVHLDELVSSVFEDSPRNSLPDSVTDDINIMDTEATWTIIDIDVQPGLATFLDNNSSRSRQMALQQIIGRHIHAIFSRGSQQALPLIDHTDMPCREDTSGERTKKQMMRQENSLFSTLLQSGNCPVSICRLLSDIMVGSNGDDKESDSLISYGEVIHELEQMTAHPEIFLYDQDNEFHSSKLKFGERCHGRVKELTQFLKISTHLESSDNSSPHDRVECVFVSGVAGAGKSHLVQHVGNFLTDLGWMVLKAKFNREMEQRAREIVLSLFDEMISNLIEMQKGDNEADIAYSKRATDAILNTVDPSSLAGLAKFVPSTAKLIPRLDRKSPLPADADTSQWYLVFLLSKLLESILSLDRRIVLCFDDLQWCDPTMLTLIKEIIMSVGQNQHGRGNFLFVGMYRDTDINNSHPFADQLGALKNSRDVNVTEIKLLSLSKDDISDMIGSETRLPRRLVCGLADTVQKRTSGHTMFAVQLLNSLVRDSVISYSPRKVRFDWDENEILAVKTADSVATLIVSNLSSLSADALQALRTISCFGIQTSLTLIRFLEGSDFVPDGGIEQFLPSLIEEGVVELSGPSVYFSHDLVRQHIYESIPIEERRGLHLNIGKFIASKSGLDESLTNSGIEASIENLHIDQSSNGVEVQLSSCPLFGIAANQVNFAGPESVVDRKERTRFAAWNHRAGNSAASRSNFGAALYYFNQGIHFLGDQVWSKEEDGDLRLCRELFEGSARAYFAIGNHQKSADQASSIIDHVDISDSLGANSILLRSLDCMGRNTEAVSQGLALLRLLEIDISDDPTPSVVADAMSKTALAASAYSFNQLTNTTHTVSTKKRSIVNIMNALILSLFRSSSPYLPLVGCALVNYSLQHGICPEASTAFVVFSYFRICLEGKYEEGRYWSDVVSMITAKAQNSSTLQANIICGAHLSSLYHPWKVISGRMRTINEKCFRIGQIEMSLYALAFSLQFSLHGSEKLSLIENGINELTKPMMKHTKEAAKLHVLPIKIIVSALARVSPVEDFLVNFGVSLESMIVDAQYKENFFLIESLQVSRFIAAFWMGDYAEARVISQAILALPTRKMIKIQTIVHDFFAGIMAFHSYREGQGDEYLETGKEVFGKMMVWSKCSADNFQNKLLLLEAEQHASLFNINAARVKFEASIRSAQDHGLIHEQGLACELYGKFLSSIVEMDEARMFYKLAHTCYIQWGAHVKAKQLWDDHNLQPRSDENEVIGRFMNKHGREW